MDDAIRGSTGDHLRRGYFWLRLIVTIGWAIYPLGNFLTAFAGMVDDGSLSVAYNVADILNRMAFGVAILATAVLASDEGRHA
jgi:sensory rhodopsin